MTARLPKSLRRRVGLTTGGSSVVQWQALDSNEAATPSYKGDGLPAQAVPLDSGELGTSNTAAGAAPVCTSGQELTTVRRVSQTTEVCPSQQATVRRSAVRIAHPDAGRPQVPGRIQAGSP